MTMKKGSLNAFGCCVLAFSCSFSLSLSRAATSSEPTWTADLGSEIKWVESTPFGELMVATNDSLIGLNPSSGQPLWEWGDRQSLANVELSSLPGTPFYRIDYRNGIMVLDPNAGRIVFDSIDAGIDTLEETHFLYDRNAMIAIGDSKLGRKRSLAYVDMDSAKAKWMIEADAGRILSIESISEDKILVVSLFEIRCIDARSGNVLWNKPTTPESGQLNGALGGFLKALAETAVQNMEIAVDYYHSDDTFYIGSGDDEQATSTYIAYDAETGSLRWQSDLRAYPGNLIFAPQGIVSLSRPSNSATKMIGAYRVKLLDPKTGKGQWGKRGNGISLKGGATNYFRLGDQLVVCTDAGKSAFVYLFDLNTGSLLHDKPAKFSGDIYGLYASSAGIVCLGSEETNLYDPAKGEFVWKKPIRSTPELTDLRDDTFYAFDTKTNALFQLDLKSGDFKTLGKFTGKFGGKERPTRLEARDSGLLLSASQNLALVDYGGKTVFNRHYPAPTRSTLVKAFYLAQGIRASIIAAQSYYVTGAVAATSLTPEYRDADPLAKTIVGGMGIAYADLAMQAHGVAAESFRRANQRFKATQELKDSLLILTKDADGIALLKVDKDSGESQRRVDLGQDKTPQYTFDAFEDRLFLEQGRNRLAGYRM